MTEITEWRPYRELAKRTDGPPGSSWGIFGAADELGCLNLLTADRVRNAVRAVRSGQVIGLDFPLDYFKPPLAAVRSNTRHVITQLGPNVYDDHLDSLYLQSTSQIDGLRHRRHHAFGFYNGHLEEAIEADSPVLGINRIAERGIVGRGLLVDIARYLKSRGRALDHDASEAISTELVEETLTWQGSATMAGDVLIIRVGFAEFYAGLPGEGRRDFPMNMRSAGLAQSTKTLEWLWDRQCSMVASDNIGVEAIPASSDSPFDPEDGGKMHQDFLALLGMPLGELWRLDALSDACAARGSHDFLVVAKPLAVVGGVGSPANAVAIL